MTAPTVSVIVVSRDRPAALVRCLKGLEQQDHPDFEVIVVSDAQGIAALDRSGHGPCVKNVPFDEANISEARNSGLARAVGELVAFIDDDAVAEPTWLSYLTEPFCRADVIAAGGYVRGRNGISFQSRAQTVDSHGWPLPLKLKGDAFEVFQGSPGHAIKTEGTNCAFRLRDILALGGFDPAFHFYMDETDLNMRLANAGLLTAIVPLAQVHHGFAPSPRRWRSRMPRTLFDIGASHTFLLRKHTGAVAPSDLSRIRDEQRRRLVRNLVAGNCEPRDVGRLMRTLEEGISAGRTRPLASLPPLPPSGDAFLPFARSRVFTASTVLAGRTWRSSASRKAAAERVKRGQRTSLFLFSPTARFHRVAFTDAGVWEQIGGIFGRSDRSGPILRLTSFSQRVKKEAERVAQLRNFTKLHSQRANM